MNMVSFPNKSVYLTCLNLTAQKSIIVTTSKIEHLMVLKFKILVMEIRQYILLTQWCGILLLL